MDNRDLLYSNKFIPHPLRPVQRSTGLRDPTASSLIRNYNAQQRQQTRSHTLPKHGASNQILPQTTRRTLFDQQMKRTKDNNQSEYQLQRTTVSIDSAHRQTGKSFLNIPFFGSYLSGKFNIEKIEIKEDSEEILMKITFGFSELDEPQKEFLRDDFPLQQVSFIVQNISQWPNVGMNQSQNTYFGIPLQHINYDSSTGYPIHISTLIESDFSGSSPNISGTVSITGSLTKQTNLIGISSLTPTSSISGSLPTTWDDVNIIRITDIVPGYPTSQRYKINLGYTFKNVVAVRLLNTIIPNVSYMINSTTRKNNKLQWVNECSRVKVPQDVLYPTNMSGVAENYNINISGGILIKNFHSSENTPGAYIINKNAQDETIDTMFMNGSGISISGTTPLLTMYSLRHITLHGGSYTPDTLATELEKELNKELSSSSTHDHGFNEFSWQLGHFQNGLQTNDFYRSERTVPSTARFFVDTEEKKRILSIQQCRRIYYNNKSTLDGSQQKVAISGPFCINAGIPYLYIYHPGALLQSGDSIRIANALDILNIKENELNREHRVIICSVIQYEVEIHVPQTSQPIDVSPDTGKYNEEHPFTLFDIIREKNSGVTNFGRIIKVKRDDESGKDATTKDKYKIHVEMMRGNDFILESILITNESNVICKVSKIEPQINAHTGYNIKLSHVPSRSILTGIGTAQLFIGTPIAFKILFGAEESPRDVLGCRSDMSGQNNEPVQCAKVQSNVIDIQKIHIKESHILPSTTLELMHTVALKLVQECQYSVGDRIYINHHMPFVDLHIDQDMFGFSFTKIEKFSVSGVEKVKLTVDKSSYQSRNSQFGEIPDSYLAWPFSVGQWIYICHNEKVVSVYEKKQYIVTLQNAKTYESGKTLGTCEAIVQETAYESRTFRVQVPDGSPEPAEIFDDANIERVELARAMRNDEYLFRTQGIPNGSYQILNTSGSTITLDVDWDSLHMPLTCTESEQTGFGRTFYQKLPITSLTSDSSNITIGINGKKYQNLHENIIYMTNSTGFREYFTTTPHMSETEELKFQSNSDFSDWENINIQKCSSAYRTVLNDHNGFFITSISDDKKTVYIQVPKNILKVSVNGVEHEEHIALYKRYHENSQTLYGQFGTICMHEVDKPYIVADNFMYLKCPTLATLRNTEKHSLQDIFAKIMLPGKVGAYVFDTFVSTPKIFHDHPLRELYELYFHFVDKYGETIEFNELEHSIVLEIVEAKERLESMNVQMSK